MNPRNSLFNALMVAVFITCFSIASVHAQVPGVVPDLSIWVNTWFKVKMTSTVYHFSDIGVKPTPNYTVSESGGTSYIKITGWDTTTTPADPFLTADVYIKNVGIWGVIDTVNIYYFAGSNLKFVGSALTGNPLADDPGQAFSLMFVFTGKRNATNTKFILDGSTKLSTIGSSIVEIDDVPGSKERWAGSTKLSGPMVPESSLPFTP